MKFDIKSAFKSVKKMNPFKKNKRAQVDDGKQTFDENNGENPEKKEKFFDRVGEYFSPEPQKERVLRHEDFNGAGDVYYASVSAFYKIIERFLWLVLAVFLAFSVITNYREITFDNFFYLLKDFSSASDSAIPEYQVLSYDSDSRQNFALYRGGLVSASPSAVSVFTSGGRRTLKSNTEYYSPNIVCCDKYVLVYDSAGSAFSVYNSFSKLHSERLDSPITDACFAPDGSFAVVTKNDDGKSVIRFYGKNLKYRGTVSDSMYVMDVSLNESGDKFCKISYQSGDGSGLSVLTVFDIKNSQTASKIATINIDGEFPIGCSFIDGDRIAILTNRSVRIYDKNFKESEKEEFYKESIRAFDISRNGVSLVIGSGSEKKVLVFDKKGEKVYNNHVTENVSSIKSEGKYLFLQMANGVTRIDIQKNDSEYLHCDSGKMLIYNESTAMVCGSARAEYLVFGRK